MSRGLNKVMLIGRLGRDPEMRYTPSGRPVTTFSLATSRTWNTSEGERRTDTEWFTIVAWGSLAEICKQYLVKGQQVYIEGRLQTRHWEDNDGNKRPLPRLANDDHARRPAQNTAEVEAPEATITLLGLCLPG
jgi:single-strand DNA-binding protein